MFSKSSLVKYVVIAICLFFASCKNKWNTNKDKCADTLLNYPDEVAAIKKAINADIKSKQIKDAILKKVNQEGFNGNVLVAQKGIVLYQGTFGMANFEQKDTLRQNSKFQLASLSKTFTAVAVLKLCEQGKIGLENTVQDYFPNFPYQGITIRSLLSHRSGLPHYEYVMDDFVRKQKIYPTNLHVINWFSKQKIAAHNFPDRFFGYNNLNFCILAAIVEKTTKQPFDIYLRKNIFEPLCMNDTFVISSKDSSFNVLKTTGYQNGKPFNKDFYDDVLGDKGVYSTTQDLYRWYKGLISYKIITKESTKEAFTPRSFERAGFRNYGLGFRLWTDGKTGVEYVYHTGWWKGYNTIMWFDPREEFVIIILSNKFNRTVYNIRELVSILQTGSKNSTVEENILDE